MLLLLLLMNHIFDSIELYELALKVMMGSEI
jgi:hypothetical protein